MSSETLESITGSCLCGSVKYSVTLPPGESFKDRCTTCQCEQCRKNTGSLVMYSIRVPTSAVTFSSQSTLKTFHATPGCSRGFCGDCGSFMSWKSDASDKIALAVGSFDKQVLLRWGSVLADARTHLWCADEIPGVTDHLQGDKWKYDSDGEDAEKVN